MALKAVKAVTLNDRIDVLTITAPVTTDAISTVLSAGGVTILIGDTADKGNMPLAATIDAIRDKILEDGVDGT